MELGKTFKTFGMMPTFIGSVELSSDWLRDKSHELKWGKHFCGTFGVVDIPEFTDIYLSQHNEPVGRTWQNHHTQFAEFTLENLGGDIDCLEIGAGSGVLLKEIELAAKREFRWDIVDPNPLEFTNRRGNIVRGFFPEAISREKENRNLSNQNLIHSHLIEHVPNVPEFLKSCNDFLPLGGKMIFSYPNFDVMARNLDLNMLMFEHLTFLPFREIEALILKAGFEISEMKYFEKHSIFVSATKKKLAKTNKFVSTINEEEFEDLALNFKTDLERFALLINQELDKEPSDLWLFGAHIFTQFILSTNLRKQRITGILDNAKHKKGKRLYGSPFEIFNPAEVKFQKSIIVLAAGQYEEEIIETLIPLLPKGSKIISKNKGIIFI